MIIRWGPLILFTLAILLIASYVGTVSAVSEETRAVNEAMTVMFLVILLILVLATFAFIIYITSEYEKKRTLNSPKIDSPAYRNVSVEETTENTNIPEAQINDLAPHDVFISYSNPDKKIADAICNSLESSKIRCWIAPRDPPAGPNYQASIIDAIDASKIMVLIFSKSSNNSPHVLTEVNRAMSKGLIIIPFRLEDIPLSKEMEYLIGTRHWLDAMSPPLERHITKLVNDVAHLLKDAGYKKT